MLKAIERCRCFVCICTKERKENVKNIFSLSLSPLLWLARSVLNNFACFFLVVSYLVYRHQRFNLTGRNCKSIIAHTHTRSVRFRRDNFDGEWVLPFDSLLIIEVENETDVGCFLRDAFLAEVTKTISLAFSCSLSLPLMWRQVAINASGFVDEEIFRIDLSLAESIEEKLPSAGGSRVSAKLKSDMELDEDNVPLSSCWSLNCNVGVS